MSGTTTDGWPYVTPDDHPKEYPAASQQLAEKLSTAQSGGFVNGLVTNGSGAVSVPHQLNRTPEYALVTMSINNPNPAGFYANVLGWDATHVSIGFYQPGGAPLADTGIFCSVLVG